MKASAIRLTFPPPRDRQRRALRCLWCRKLASNHRYWTGRSVASQQQKLCSFFGTTYFDLRRAQPSVSSITGLGCLFINTQFSHPEAAVRKCLRLFCGGFLKMIVEVTTVLFLIQGVRVVSRLIETRRDVFYYVEARQRTYV